MAKSSGLNLFKTGEGGRLRDYTELLGTFAFRPTLFLGLGGTGSQAVAKVKQLFINLVAPQMHRNLQAQTAEIDPLFAFLAFDTDGTAIPAGMKNREDWFHLAIHDLPEFYQGMGRDPFFSSWIVKDYPAGAVEAGAGGIRNLGRMALLSNINTANEEISKARQQIIDAAAGINVVTTKPLVHVFCSVSGGTGSGMLLDTCFLVRQLIPGAKIIGHIAVLDGLPSLTPLARTQLRINTFCGLKELDAFMTRQHPSVPIGRIQYPFDVAGRVQEPVDFCLLSGSYRADGTSSLPEQAHISSFLARIAFTISAYSFHGDGQLQTPDFEGVMINVATALVGVKGGARTCYLTPGFTQAHFPVGDTADLFTVATARKYLEYQRGGIAPDGNADARSFFDAERLNCQNLREEIGRDPRDEKHPVLISAIYDELLEELFKISPYEKREEILAFANAIPSQRLAELSAILSPNVNEIVHRVSGHIRDTAAGFLESDKYLGLGTLDFLSDLKILLETERGSLTHHAGSTVEANFADLPAKWSIIQANVTNAVTDSGFVDRVEDAFHRKDTIQLYSNYLNMADRNLLEKAVVDLAKSLFSQLIQVVDSLHTSLAGIAERHMTDAIAQLAAKEVELNTRLHSQANAGDISAENVRSFNVMTEEWRNAYLKDRALTPASVLANLKEHGWRPISLLSTQAAPGVPLGKRIAQDLLDQIEPYFDPVRTWTPLDVLENNATVMRMPPEDLVARVYSTLLQPQLQIGAMHNRLATAPFNIVFSGGITEEFKQRLHRSGKLGNVTFNPADNQETNRINFTSITMPIALAGCDLVTSTLEPEYNTWREQLDKEGRKEKEKQMAQYHCFPGSTEWRSPTKYSLGHDQFKETFAKALAVSEMLRVSPDDEKKMRATAKTPKEQRYALFQVGDSQFWLWPAFTPDDSTSLIKGKPTSLGTNIAGACETLERDPALMHEAAEWAHWFEEHWSDNHSAADIQKLRETALQRFAERKGRATNQQRIDLWDEVAAIARDWNIG
jgi:hypothetical protein